MHLGILMDGSDGKSLPSQHAVSAFTKGKKKKKQNLCL